MSYTKLLSILSVRILVIGSFRRSNPNWLKQNGSLRSSLRGPRRSWVRDLNMMRSGLHLPAYWLCSRWVLASVSGFTWKQSGHSSTLPSFQVQVQQEKRRKETPPSARSLSKATGSLTGAHAFPWQGASGSSAHKYRTQRREGWLLGHISDCYQQKGKLLMLGHQNSKWPPIV